MLRPNKSITFLTNSTFYEFLYNFLFQSLLLEDCSESSVIILPDVSSHTMSLLLDYIYAGTVIVYSNTIDEFLVLANLFKINTEINTNSFLLKNPKILDEVKDFTKESIAKTEKEYLKEVSLNLKNKKCTKELPALLPIRPRQRKTVRKSLCGYIIPSPWFPRKEKIFDNPRIEDSLKNSTPIYNEIVQNDKNNNLQTTRLFPDLRLTEKQNNIHTFSSGNIRNESIPEVTNWKKNFHQQIISPISPLDPLTPFIVSPSMNNTSPSSTIPNRFDFSPRDPKDKISQTASQRTVENPSVIFENLDEVTNSSKTEVANSRLCLQNQPPSYKNNEEFSVHSPNDSSGDSNSSVDVEKCETISVKKDVVGTSEKEKPYKCDDCGKGFSQMRNYKYHR